MSCMELTDLQANGTQCDMDKVCHNGSCDSCVDGMVCDVTGKPCRVGSVVCATGAPVCTETDNKPNGTSCGTGMVCQAGTCATCQEGGACTPTNKCHTGTLVCRARRRRARTRTERRRRDVLRYGHGLQRHGRLRRLHAGHGLRRARQALPQGNDRLQHGHARLHRVGRRRQRQRLRREHGLPGRELRGLLGRYDLRAGEPVPRRHDRLLAEHRLHRHGQRARERRRLRHRQGLQRRHMRLVRGRFELPAHQRLQDGHDVVRDRLPVCIESGNRANGTSCGTNMVCNNGTCATCSAGGACTPTNPCHMGTLTCTTGAPTCTDTGQNQADGTSCGTNLVCKTGSCVSCTAGQACQPTNPCATGVTSCATGASVCTVSGNKGAGTLCGAGQSCANGVLTLPAMCNAAGTCAAATMQCSTGCNTAGTDCATCPTGQTSCPAGCRDSASDPANCSSCGNACPLPSRARDSGVLELHVRRQVQPWFRRVHASFAGDVPADDVGLRGHDPRGVQNRHHALGGRQDRLHQPVVHSGKFALGAVIKATGTGLTRNYQIGPPICAARGPIIAKGATVTAWMLLEPSDPKLTFGTGSYWGIRITTESGQTLATGAPRGYNIWFPVSVPIPAGDVRLISFVLEGVFRPRTPGCRRTGPAPSPSTTSRSRAGDGRGPAPSATHPGGGRYFVKAPHQGARIW